MQRKAGFSFAFLSFFRNFVRFLSFSLYKGSLGDWWKSGLRIGNRTQFHILLWIAFKERPMMCHQPYYDSSSGAKLRISEQNTKIFEDFRTWVTSRQGLKGNHSFWKNQIYSHLFFRAYSTPLNWLRHFVWHLLEKCVLGYVLLPNDSAVIL